jgi:hypothetical protein
VRRPHRLPAATGWRDVATTTDLTAAVDRLSADIDRRFAHMDRRFALLRVESAEANARLMRTLVVTFVSSLAAFGALVLAAAALGGR